MPPSPPPQPLPVLSTIPLAPPLHPNAPLHSLSHPALTPSSTRPPIASLYIHIPFCSHKCHYCDFYSFVDTRDQQHLFTSRLIAELRALAPHAHNSDGSPHPLRTIFIGGGTPSLLRLDLWNQLLSALSSLFDLSAIRANLGEWTVECNPESASLELLQLLRSFGVNRISLGAQSFTSKHLRTLERTHNPDNVRRALEFARSADIPRTSIDLIYAIPGQTLDDWHFDLHQALALRTTHLSCYNLTYEPNTAMTKRLRAGEFVPISEDLEVEMDHLTLSALRAVGLERYEVSNFSVPGHESLHNLAYWLQHQWLAAGPSASGHAYAGSSALSGSWRWKNIPRLGDYLASAPSSSAPLSAYAPITDLEHPDPLRLIRERLMMGLRLTAGINARQLLSDLNLLNPAAVEPLLSAAKHQSDLGTLQTTPDTWRLTDSGMLLCDAIAASLMRAVTS